MSMYLQIQLIKLYYEHDDVSTSLSLSSVQDRAPLDAQELMDAEKTLMMMLRQQRRGGGGGRWEATRKKMQAHHQVRGKRTWTLLGVSIMYLLSI